MSKKIKDFFQPTKSSSACKRKADETFVEEQPESRKQAESVRPSSETSTKKPSGPTTASLKTAMKWQKELHITLGYKMKDNSDSVFEIWCTVCREFAKDRKSSFVTGCSHVKKESVRYHKDSDSHKRAMEIKSTTEKVSQNKPTPLEEGFKKMDETTLIKMDKLFRTAYYIAKEERPFTDFAPLIELQTLNGVPLGETYQNDKGAKLFISQISGSMFDE